MGQHNLSYYRPPTTIFSSTIGADVSCFVGESSVAFSKYKALRRHYSTAEGQTFISNIKHENDRFSF
jgi:hypothetical protein